MGCEDTMPELTRITRDQNTMGGKPCIRGMRLTVGTVVGLVAAGRTQDEIFGHFHTSRQKTSRKRCPTRRGGQKKLK